MRHEYGVAVLMIALSPLLTGADGGCVTSPPFDSIVTPSTRPVTVSMFSDGGTVANGEVELLVDGVSQGTGATVGGKFTYPSVPLNTVGKHIFGGSTRRTVNGTLIEGTIIPQQVHVRDDIIARGKQEVMFYFWPIAEQRLKEIANGTMEPDPSPAQLNELVAGVKAKARQIFEQLYAPFNVVLVNQASPGGDGVVVVGFGDADAALPGVLGTNIEYPIWDLTRLGRSIPDFNNRFKTQYPRVFLGSIRDYMLFGDFFILETAAEQSDTLDLRIRDLGVALGLIAVHEVGHTLGLVIHPNLIEELAEQYGVPVADAIDLAKAIGVTFPLADLQGCRVGHNCPELEDPLASRFGGGFDIMDPGEEVPLHARFGFANASTRQERMPTFNNYNASYLSIVHPKP